MLLSSNLGRIGLGRGSALILIQDRLSIIWRAPVLTGKDATRRSMKRGLLAASLSSTLLGLEAYLGSNLRQCESHFMANLRAHSSLI